MSSPIKTRTRGPYLGAIQKNTEYAQTVQYHITIGLTPEQIADDLETKVESIHRRLINYGHTEIARYFADATYQAKRAKDLDRKQRRAA